MKRRTAWAQTDFDFNLVTGTDASKSAVDLLENYRSNGGNTAGVTIARTHFDLIPRARDHDFAGGLPTVAFGVYVDDIDEVADGTQDAPVSDPYSDWMYNVAGALDQGVTVPMTAIWADFLDYRHDIRSKRKLEQLGRTLIFSIQTVNVSGPAVGTVDFHLHARVLLMLP